MGNIFLMHLKIIFGQFTGLSAFTKENTVLVSILYLLNPK